MTQSDNKRPEPGVPDDSIDMLLRFAAMMFRSGGTATRTRELVGAMAHRLNLETPSVSLTLESVTLSVYRGSEQFVAIREIGPPGIDFRRLGELERLANAPEATAPPHRIATELAEIESRAPRYSGWQMAIAIGLASGGFAFLNGAALPEMATAAIGGGTGQGLRWWLTRRQLTDFGTAALAAVTAAGTYVLVAALAHRAGIAFSHYAAGFISTILFLIPGVSLIAGLFDLLQHQTVAALSRLAHGALILFIVASGLSIVMTVASIELLPRSAPAELAYPLRLSLRAVASFVAGCGFAMLFNSAPFLVVVAGIVALAANSVRLVLIDMGMLLAPAAFIAAFSIGIIAVLASRRLDAELMAIVPPPVVIMIPGLYAFEMLVLFNRGQMLEAMQASGAGIFVISALAMGLSVARLAVPWER